MKTQTLGTIAAIGAAAAVLTFAGVTFAPLLSLGHSQVEEAPAPSVRQFVPEAAHPTPLPTVTPIPSVVVEEAPAPAPVEEPPATVDGNGGVIGSGCPLPYVDLGYGCQDPICGVDANGNDIPCQP